MVFTARYSGLCIPCGEDIEVGEMLVSHPQAGYVHEGCIELVGQAPRRVYEDYVEPFDQEHGTSRVRVMPRGKTVKDKCTRCFMIHSSGQDDCE